MIDVLRKIYRRLKSIPLFVFGTITHVSTSKPAVALTFDDGPDPVFTPRLLDILQQHHAKATFFMVGQAAERHPDLVKKAAAAGHAIGNHSWDHPSFPLLTGHERRAQIRACAKSIAPYAQQIFRPPYADQNLLSRLDALWLGYQVITYNATAMDWLDHDADWIKGRIMSRMQNGSIILFHDSLFRHGEDRYVDREPMLKAVDMLLNELSGRLSFMTVPELLRQGRPQRQYWHKQTDIDVLNGLKGQYGEVRRYSKVG